MKVARGVSLSNLKIEMKICLETVENVFLKLANRESYITCTDKGIHSAGSLHYYGYAIDYRTRFLSKTLKNKIFEAIKADLPKGFDVILHKTHLHVEWDDAKKLIMIGKV